MRFVVERVMLVFLPEVRAAVGSVGRGEHNMRFVRVDHDRVLGICMMALSACGSPPPDRAVEPIAKGDGTPQSHRAGDGARHSDPPPAADGPTVIAALSIRLRLPTGVTVDEVKPRTDGQSPSFWLKFPGAGATNFEDYHGGWVDPLPHQRKVAHGPPTKHMQNKEIVLDEADALIVEADSPLLGRHCTVTACSSTQPSYCVFGASGSVVYGEVMKLSNEQCRQVVDIVRSIENLP